MKQSIFTFFIFLITISMLSSCATSKKGGCGCPGAHGKTIENRTNQV